MTKTTVVDNARTSLIVGGNTTVADNARTSLIVGGEQVSDTPRTDAMIYAVLEGHDLVHADDCRTLERELAEADSGLHQCRLLLKDNVEAVGSLKTKLAEARKDAKFTPTHRHASGTHYQFIANGQMKEPEPIGEWRDAVIYRASNGAMYCCTRERWLVRFTALEASRAK